MQARVVTGDILEEALARAGRDRQRLGEALVALGAATVEDVLKAVVAQPEIPQHCSSNYYERRGAPLDRTQAP